jgi:hypothetical protein
METLDLDILNYNYEDLLKLFQLPYDFTINELKNAKKIVYTVHPDKSKLPKEYFIFFSKAYKMLIKLYEFKKSANLSINEHDEYENIEKFSSDENKTILMQQKEFEKSKTDPKVFNEWFNKIFEEANSLNDNQNKGHGEWLKNISNEEHIEAKNPFEMQEIITKKKEKLRDNLLVLHKEFEPLQSSANYNLFQDQNNSSDIFSKLQYEDVKSAHEHSVIPVSEQDFINYKKFNSIDEINRARTIDSLTYNKNYNNHNEILERKKFEENNESVNSYYTLLKRDQVQKEKNNEIWKKLKTITYK